MGWEGMPAHLPAKEAVAMVSSCSHLPWMMEVWPLRVWLSTAFHTLLQQAGGQAGRQAGGQRWHTQGLGSGRWAGAGWTTRAVLVQLLILWTNPHVLRAH